MIFPRLQGPNRTLAQLVALVITLVFTTIVVIPPFYDWFCRVTGFGGTTSVADAGAERVLEETIKVRFDASLEQGMPWTFRPAVPSMEIRIGESGLAFYEAYNPTSRPVAGTASFNVYPYAAGGYFTKIECFCFQEQVLQPGETVQMPVSFYVDPAIVDDPEGRFVHEIVLSYTFHQTPLPEEQAALDAIPAPDDGAVN
jgi:cytochrome c oxidase assembly protein subunit 11